MPLAFQSHNLINRALAISGWKEIRQMSFILRLFLATFLTAFTVGLNSAQAEGLGCHTLFRASNDLFKYFPANSTDLIAENMNTVFYYELTEKKHIIFLKKLRTPWNSMVEANLNGSTPQGDIRNIIAS